MRVILDTNVLLSALLSPHGAPAKLLDAWKRGVFVLINSDELLAELREVVTRPFFLKRLRPGAAELLTQGLQTLAINYGDVPAGPVAPDAKDSFLLALAEIGQADFLVTGDSALLALVMHKSTRITSPAVMLVSLTGDSQ
jgi:hypothetical protein